MKCILCGSGREKTAERTVIVLKKKILVLLPAKEHQKSILDQCIRESADRWETVYTNGQTPTEEELREAAVVIGNLDPALAKHAVNMRWLQLASAGYDAFLTPGVLPAGTVLTNASGAYGLSVSEHMLALTFAMLRRFGPYGRSQVRREWKPLGGVTAVEGSTVAVLGLGDIGGSYARKMKALGAYVIGVRKALREKPDYLDEQYTMEELSRALCRADIVAMALPGGPETHHLMDRDRLSQIKKGAFLLNVGRGNAIEPQALKEALRSKHLRGAALDVTEPEPLPTEDELWEMDNVILTPHVAGFLAETQQRVVLIAADNLSRWIRGEPLRNVVSR